MNKDQQLAEAIVKAIGDLHNRVWFPEDDKLEVITAAILPLIAEFKKEVAGEAFTAGRDYAYWAVSIIDTQTTPPDRATYIDNLNK